MWKRGSLLRCMGEKGLHVFAKSNVAGRGQRRRLRVGFFFQKRSFSTKRRGREKRTPVLLKTGEG